MRAWGITVAVLTIAVAVGLAGGEHWLFPFDAGSELDERILWDLRWPRVQTAAAVGALLAIAGAALQALLGNPLAEPYVLGVSGSSSIGALAALVIWPEARWPTSAGAFLGACAGVSAILPFSRLGPHRLLLAGVVMAALWGAAVTMLLALLPDRELGKALGWMMGNLAGNIVPNAWLWVAVVGLVAFGVLIAPALDRLLLGETHAEALGTTVARIRLAVLLLASAATALAVTAAGTIGFVGLVVPHTMRLLFGPMHRSLLPASAMGGAALLMLADTGSRVLIAPAELPVGAVTAVIGVPVFLWLLTRRATWS